MDFYQEYITTIHDFSIDKERLVKRIDELKEDRPSSLIIPILYGEVENPPLKKIITDLNECTYISQVVVALAAENTEQYVHVVEYFKDLKLPHVIVWCDGPRIQQILLGIKEKGIDLTSFKGKGKDVWIATGIATLDSYAIAYHDADIVTYSVDYPAKLLYPIVEPELNFFFNKGYYARINMDSMSMHGRVFRLFIRPLLDTLQMDCKVDILRYLLAFRYTLAGEFAMTSDLAMNIRIPADWGLEVGILTEVYRNTTTKKVCQIDLGYYDHKHQGMGDDLSEGLCKMVADIFTTFMRVMTESTDNRISESFLHGIHVKYKRLGQDLIRRYHADALCNGLSYNRHEEESYVDMFARVIMKAGEDYMHDPSDVLMPDWTRALSAMPDLREQLYEACSDDVKEYCEGK
ncbi:glucosyl-3-phosphoglycerate synthase [Methanococcoides sp. SA1]|nr:glucosyl-3-phosphoglycerate synthase [Methanococcoides sp. SA1]NPE30481.1 glucosyl-3-phosphoglycerate synthase [Methanococcoides sp. SA1]